jgi:hypothetical protein
MKLLENEELQRMVDYSFGDHSGVLGGVPNAYMKKVANAENITGKGMAEFNDFVWNFKGNRPITLFIDNIRLYRRPLEYSDWLHTKPISEQDRLWLSQFDDEDLLKKVGGFHHEKFIIFTAFEDTPLDDYIWGKIPENVLAIHAANAVIFGGKVHPFPHGIERIMYPGYNHHEILREMIDSQIAPEKLLFVAHREDTGDRSSIGSMFRDKEWATVTHLPYEEYLKGIKKHRFVLCPSGNGIDTIRSWETLYMKRVPVFKDHPYMREMFKDFPALFVKDWEDLTEELLLTHNHLYNQAQEMDMNKLDLDYWFNKALK